MKREDEHIATDKPAVCGQACEGYRHESIIGNNLFATIGAHFYDYTYTGNGNTMGEPPNDQ